MTQDTKYNGWSNYATWRVNLEMFDGQSPEDVTGDRNIDADDLADALKDQADNIISGEGSREGLAVDYARAFLSDVDWQEIAEGMVDAYKDERDPEQDDEAETVAA